MVRPRSLFVTDLSLCLLKRRRIVVASRTIYAAHLSSPLGVAFVHFLFILPAGKAQLFLFLMTASHLKLKGALDAFYTAPPECLPDGPFFEKSFFLAWTAIIGALCGLLGVTLFQLLLSRTWIRLAFWSTTLLGTAAAVVDIIIVMVRGGLVGSGGETESPHAKQDNPPRESSAGGCAAFCSRTNPNGTLGWLCFFAVTGFHWRVPPTCPTTASSILILVPPLTPPSPQRWNKRIGILDKAFYVLGDSMLQEVVR